MNSYQTLPQTTFQSTLDCPSFTPSFKPTFPQTTSQTPFTCQSSFSTQSASFQPSLSLNSNVKEFTPSKTPLQSMAANSVMSTSFTPCSYEFQSNPVEDLQNLTQNKSRYQALRKNGIPTNFNAINQDRYKTQRCRRYH